MTTKKKPLTFDELEDALAADFATNATREELEEELARMGIDAETVASRARQIADERTGSADAASWRTRAREKLAAAREKVRRTVGRYADMTRDELLARIDDLKNHPSLTQPVTAAFRKRSPAESTDDELRAILADMEALVEIAGQSDTDEPDQT